MIYSLMALTFKILFRDPDLTMHGTPYSQLFHICPMFAITCYDRPYQSHWENPKGYQQHFHHGVWLRNLFHWHFKTLIPVWISTRIFKKVWDELIIISPTPISSHTLPSIWLMRKHISYSIASLNVWTYGCPDLGKISQYHPIPNTQSANIILSTWVGELCNVCFRYWLSVYIALKHWGRWHINASLNWASSANLNACCLFGAKPLPEPMMTYCELDKLKHEQTSMKS